jgi:hypothetical protein
MSNVVITGNASGTGDFTIEAPNSNTDRTLTLPDITGTVLTDSASVLNIGAGQVYKDASGNVGIGTSSPSYRVEVKGPAATAGQLSLHDGTGNTVTSGNNAGSLLFQARDSDIRTIAEIDGVHTTTNGTGGAMVFQTRVSDTLAERMRIDVNGNLSTTGTYTTSNLTPMTAGSVASNPGTTAIWDGSGNLYKLSSSARYKENIAEWVVTDVELDAFVNLNPKLWDYIGKENGCAGFIAEDLETLGLKNVYNTSPLINYSNEGEPDSNRDYALIALQHKVIQRLEKSIEALEARVTALENA